MALINKKYLPKDNGVEMTGEQTLPYMFVVPMTDGSTQAFTYIPEKDEKGKYIPLTESSFYAGLQKDEKVMFQQIAKEYEVPEAILYGVSNYGGRKVLTGTAEVNRTLPPQNAPSTVRSETPVATQQAPIAPANTWQPKQGTKRTKGYTGPLIPETVDEVSAAQMSRTPSPTLTKATDNNNLFSVSNENLEKYKDQATSNDIVIARNSQYDSYSNMDISPVAAVATLLLAQNVRGITDEGVAYISDPQLEKIFSDYMKTNGITVTEEEKKQFVKDVRSYKAETYFPPSTRDAQAIRQFMKGQAVGKYNAKLVRGVPAYTMDWYENWYENRGVPEAEVKHSDFSDSPEIIRAIKFYQDPENNMNTILTEKEEKEFQKWVQQEKENGNIPEADNSFDYDYRGYWKTYASKGRDVRVDGHYPDMFKKPNHPTFSTESIWAKNEFKGYATDFKNGQFVPARVKYPRENQIQYLEYRRNTDISIDEAVYDLGTASVKQMRGVIEPDPSSNDETITGYASPVATVYGEASDEADAESTSAPISGTAINMSPDSEYVDFLHQTFGISKAEIYAARAFYPTEDMAQWANEFYGTNLFSASRALALPIYEDLYTGYFNAWREQALSKNSFRILSNWESYTSSPSLKTFPSAFPGKGKIAMDDFNDVVGDIYENPVAVMNATFPSLKSKYDEIANLYDQRDAAQTNTQIDANGNEVTVGDVNKVADLDKEIQTRSKEYRIDRLQTQTIYFPGSTPLVFDEGQEKGILQTITAGATSQSENIQVLNEAIGGNFQVLNAWVLQASTEYDLKNRAIKITTAGSTKRDTQREGGTVTYIPAYAAWASGMPGYIPMTGGREDLYYKVASGVATEDGSFFDQADRSEKELATQFINDRLSWLDDRLYKDFGTNQSLEIRSATRSLKDMYLYLGYTTGPQFNRKMVGEEIQKFRDSFLLSSRYSIILDKDSASMLNISSTNQLDAGLAYAVTQAKRKVEDGSVVLEPGKASSTNAMNIQLRHSSSAIVPVVSGDYIFFALKDRNNNGNILYLDNDRGNKVPFHIRLSDVFRAGGYDSKSYVDFVNKTSLTLAPRSYVEQMENYQANLYPGYTVSTYRGKAARTIHQLISYYYLGGDSSAVTQDMFFAADNDIYTALFLVEQSLNNSPFRKKNVTNQDVESFFWNTLKNELDFSSGLPTRPGVFQSRVLEIPSVQRAFEKTISKFTIEDNWLVEGAKNAITPFIAGGTYFLTGRVLEIGSYYEDMLQQIYGKRQAEKEQRKHQLQKQAEQSIGGGNGN